MRSFLMAATLLIASSNLLAAELIINGAEFGIGKFHRKDNKVHKYEKNNAWKPFILPEGVTAKTAYVMKNSAENYTIFFTNLEEFLSKIVEISKQTGKKVAVVNLNAHGLPGGMWFPKDAKTRDSFECASWREAANNSDEDNYKQYYTAIKKDEILEMQQMGNAQRIPAFSCLTGVEEWKEVVARVKGIKEALTSDAQVHMHSCLVGAGPLGDNYTQGIANILFTRKDSQQVQTAIKFGLGDWSMPEGMGFWGYESDEQLRRDNARYPIHRRDSEIAQRGDIRVAMASNGKVKTGLIKQEEIMLLTKDERVVALSTRGTQYYKSKSAESLPKSVRIPGTTIRIQVR